MLPLPMHLQPWERDPPPCTSRHLARTSLQAPPRHICTPRSEIKMPRRSWMKRKKQPSRASRPKGLGSKGGRKKNLATLPPSDRWTGTSLRPASPRPLAGSPGEKHKCALSERSPQQKLQSHPSSGRRRRSTSPELWHRPDQPTKGRLPERRGWIGP